MSQSEPESLFERLGGVYGIAAAVDDLVDRLYINDTVNQNPAVKEFHETHGKRDSSTSLQPGPSKRPADRRSIRGATCARRTRT